MGRLDVEIKPDKIDKNDKKILYILSKNSRESLNQIGKKVKLSADTVSYRVKNLEKAKVIDKFIPRLSHKTLGFQKVSAFFQIINLGKKTETKFIKFLSNMKNVIGIIQYADKFDFEVVFLVRNVFEYEEAITKITNEFHYIIGDIDVFFEIEALHESSLPENFANIKYQRKKTKIKKEQIDDFDFKLLKELSKNARESSVTLAKKLKTSPDTVLYRIDKLQSGGVIKDFSSIINFSALDMSWYTLLFNLKFLNNIMISRLKEYVRKHKNIVGCYKGCGGWNLKFYLVNTTRKEFHDTINELRITFRDNIKDYDTLVGYKEHKHEIYSDVLES